MSCQSCDEAPQPVPVVVPLPDCEDPVPCEEVSSTQCFVYTGEGIPCLGIESGMNLDIVIAKISATACQIQSNLINVESGSCITMSGIGTSDSPIVAEVKIDTTDPENPLTCTENGLSAKLSADQFTTLITNNSQTLITALGDTINEYVNTQLGDLINTFITQHFEDVIISTITQNITNILQSGDVPKDICAIVADCDTITDPDHLVCPATIEVTDITPNQFTVVFDVPAASSIEVLKVDVMLGMDIVGTHILDVAAGDVIPLLYDHVFDGLLENTEYSINLTFTNVLEEIHCNTTAITILTPPDCFEATDLALELHEDPTTALLTWTPSSTAVQQDVYQLIDEVWTILNSEENPVGPTDGSFELTGLLPNQPNTYKIVTTCALNVEVDSETLTDLRIECPFEHIPSKAIDSTTDTWTISGSFEHLGGTVSQYIIQLFTDPAAEGDPLTQVGESIELSTVDLLGDPKMVNYEFTGLDYNKTFYVYISIYVQDGDNNADEPCIYTVSTDPMEACPAPVITTTSIT